MATVKGLADVRRFLAQLPGELETKVLRGAARVAANVIAEEAKSRLGDRRAEVAGGGTVLIADSVKVRSSAKDGLIVGKVQVKGPGAYVAPWLEYGTAPHLISVSDKAREGRSIGKINQLVKKGSLAIGGQFVGESVQHPGARPHPFLRVSLDTKEAEAIAAAQSYINARISPAGIAGSVETDEGEA